MTGMSLIWIIFIGFAILSWLVSHQLQVRFKKYSKIPTANGMTGRDVVEKIDVYKRQVRELNCTPERMRPKCFSVA